MTTRLVVRLTPEEADALARMAYEELRDPREQLRLLLRREARSRGLLVDAEPPQRPQGCEPPQH